jgi:hypothetical protein
MERRFRAFFGDDPWGKPLGDIHDAAGENGRIRIRYPDGTIQSVANRTTAKAKLLKAAQRRSAGPKSVVKRRRRDN